MVHFEFGQDRLTEPYPLKAFQVGLRCDQSSVRDSIARWFKHHFRMNDSAGTAVWLLGCAKEKDLCHLWTYSSAKTTPCSASSKAAL